MPTNEELKEIYRRLAAPFPEEAIERTRADVTRKGYDTTGIKYQYVVNRLNEVLGVGGFRVERTFSIKEKQSRSGMPMVDVTCDVVMQLGHWEAGVFVAFAEATGTGGHVSASEADAKKGAYTNAFKKTAAFFGVGRQAYEGTLDDDNVPADGTLPAEPERTRAAQPVARPNSAPAPVQEERPARGTGNGGAGRVTSAQLAKLHELVDQVRGGDWSGFRDDIRELHGVTVEYLSKTAASGLIGNLIDEAKQRKGNGNGRAERGAA